MGHLIMLELIKQINKFTWVISVLTMGIFIAPIALFASVEDGGGISSVDSPNNSQFDGLQEALGHPSAGLQQEGMIQRYSNLSMQGLRPVLQQIQPWSLTVYEGPNETVPATQATQVSNGFAESFTAEHDRNFLFGEAADQKWYEVIILPRPDIQNLPLDDVPGDRAHVKVIAHPQIKTEDTGFADPVQQFQQDVTDVRDSEHNNPTELVE